VDGIAMTFARSQFESAMYSHCSIFKRFLGASPLTVASCCASCVDDDPILFSYQDDYYKVNLLALLRSVLIAAARLVADGKSLLWTKDNCVEVILTHFCRQQMMLSAMYTDESCLTISPPDRFRLGVPDFILPYSLLSFKPCMVKPLPLLCARPLPFTLSLTWTLQL